LFITFSVTKRAIIGTEITGVHNYSEFCLVLAIYSGLAITQIYGEHISTEIVYRRLTGWPRKVVAYFGYYLNLLLAVFLFSAVAYTAWQSYLAKESTYAATMLIPVWPVKFTMLVGLALYVLYFFLHFRKVSKE